MHFQLFYLLLLLLSLPGNTEISPPQELTVEQCPPAWQPGTKQSSNSLVNHCLGNNHNKVEPTRQLKKLDEKLVHSLLTTNHDSSCIPPPLVHALYNQEYLIIWQEADQNNRTIYKRIYDARNKQLEAMTKISSVTSPKPLNLSIHTANDNQVIIKWCPLKNCTKKLITNNFSLKRRQLANDTNIRLKLANRNLNSLPPNQDVYLNSVLTISVKIKEGYHITLQHNLTGDWWDYNNSSFELTMSPTHKEHIGSYSFHIQAQNGTEIITHDFQIWVKAPLAPLFISTESNSIGEDIFERFCISMGAGVGIGIVTILTMCGYHFCCGLPLRKKYVKLHEYHVMASHHVLNNHKEEDNHNSDDNSDSGSD